MKPQQKKLAEGSLFTDFYQLTMAQLYLRNKLAEKTVQFDYFFRNYPDYDSHQAGYCINAGMQWLLDWMQDNRFTKKDIDFLRQLSTPAGNRIFYDDFLGWLAKNGNFDAITITAIPEGRVVHPGVPLAIVRGPFAMAQILESALLNHLNYQTLIATRAARIREAGRGGLMIEFGMRRAQADGANAGARAALIGGADFTSNTGLSAVLNLPPKGTHAHSMVQAFIALGMTELDAFQAYADLYPDSCLLVVDTIDTLNSGVPNAVKVFEKLRKKGHKPLGIRLDSGDLAYLAIQSAKMLNEAGFDDTIIFLSNQLDEMVIWQIITQIQKQAPIDGIDADHLIKRLGYGVGTRLITSAGNAALDGIYKLTAVRNQNKWLPAIKLSETPAKILNPGYKNAWRIYDNRQKATADLITLGEEDPRRLDVLNLHHPSEPQTSRTLDKSEISQIEPLLVDFIKEGKLVCDLPSIDQMRKLRDTDLEHLNSGVKRLVNPHRYHVSVSNKLWNLKQRLINSRKKGVQKG